MPRGIGRGTISTGSCAATTAVVLRSVVPSRSISSRAVEHTVEWRFRAPGWTAVEGVTLAASLAILLGAVAALIYCFRKKKA